MRPLIRRLAGAWHQRAAPHLRAALVALHLFVIGAAALPGPTGSLGPALWRDRSVQSELAAWAARVGTSRERFEAWLVPKAEWLLTARGTILHALSPYLDLTGTWQPWGLFVAPDRVPARFQLQVRGDGAWETLFEERSLRYRWQADYFEQPRVRRALFWYGWPPQGAYAGRYCRWLAGRVFREHAELREVRCRFHRAPSPSPAEARAGIVPPGEWIQETVVSLAEATAK